MSKQTQAYLNAIRNKAKRAYANRYWRFLELEAQNRYGAVVQEPEHFGLSAMGAQAVRMNLIQLRRHYG